MRYQVRSLFLCSLVATLLVAFVEDGHAGSLTSVNVLNLPTNDFKFDPTRNIFYASVPGRAGVGLGNSITRIDPFSASIIGSSFVGSEPETIALSGDGSVMYVDLEGSQAIRVFDPTTLTPGFQFPVLNGYRVMDIAVLNGQTEDFVASLWRRNASPVYVGIGLWNVNGNSATLERLDGIAATNLALSDIPNVFYATSGTNLAKVTISSGPLMSATYGAYFNNVTDPDITFAGGRVYSSAGTAVDASTFTLAGNFPGANPSGGVFADPESGKVYYIHGTLIQIYDINTFVPIDTLTVPEAIGGTYNLYRFGKHGLAFTSDHDQVLFITSQSVGIPEVHTLVLSGIVIAGLIVVTNGAKRRSQQS